MNETDLKEFKSEVIKAIQYETHDAIKTTGISWVKDAVRETVPVVIEDTLTRLGIDPQKPLESQKDFAYLRQIRVESEDIKLSVKKKAANYMLTAAISLVVAGGAAWLAVKGFLVKP